MSRCRLPLLALAVSLAITACQTSTDAPPSGPGDLDSTVAAEAALETGASSETAPDEAPAVALDGEGLRLVDATSGSTRLLAFGTDIETATPVLEAALGAPDDTGRNEECGAGPLDYLAWDGLTVYGSEGALAGWYVDDRGGATFTTLAGIGPGSARAELDAAYDVTVEESSLGPEFSAGDLFGFLDDVGPDGVVTGLWAGVNCFFR